MIERSPRDEQHWNDDNKKTTMTTTPSTCPWCGARFDRRATGGKPQQFCSEACRRALDALGRAWIATALAAGQLSVEDLRNGPTATRAFVGDASNEAPRPEGFVPVELGPGTIGALVDLGYLKANRRADPEAVGIALALSVAVDREMKSATAQIWTEVLDLVRTCVGSSGG